LWTPDARTAMQRAFAAANRGHSADSFERVAREFDAFRERWRAARQDACDAVRLRGEQSEQVLALRSSCLDRKLVQFGTFVRLFTTADAKRVDDATHIIQDLPDLDACADVAALIGAADRLPEDPVARATIIALENRLDLAETLEIAGQLDDALKITDEAVASATRVKAAATEARAKVIAGAVLQFQGKSEAARTQQLAAIALGSRNGLDELVARASIQLLASLINDQRVSDAKAILPMIDAAVLRANDPPRLRAELLDRHGVLLALDQQWPAAIAMLESAIAACDRLGPEKCLATRIHTHANTELGNIYVAQRKWDLARVTYNKEIEESKRAFGVQSPRVLLAYNNLATAESSAGDVDAALATLAEARKLAATLPKFHPLAVYGPAIEANLWLAKHDCKRALPLFEEGLAGFAAVWGVDSYRVAQVSYLTSLCLDELGRLDDALAAVRRSIAIGKKTGSPGSELAEMELLEGQYLYKRPATRAAGLAKVYAAAATLRAANNAMVVADIEAWLKKQGQPLTAPLVSPPPR
jgi:eukaryotic-like serine/threonine-protein kinase